MGSGFYATAARMKYIERWALMRSSRPENLSEHAAEVAMIAHALCEIGNARFGRSLSAERAALIGLYHDMSEIITGDMPTPVKYSGARIREAYHAVEERAEEQLLSMLPDDLRPVYADIFGVGEPGGEEEAYLRKLVKAADTLSALIKCIEERQAGNSEFLRAEESTRAKLEKICGDCPEAAVFMEEFLPAYGKTLDELLGTDEKE